MVLSTSHIEVVPATQRALVESRTRGWVTEWISQNQAVAVTTEAVFPERFRSEGILHIWSLQTGKVLRSINCPAMIQVVGGNGNSPVIVVAGGPFNKNRSDPPFVWLVDLKSGNIVRRFPRWPKDQDLRATPTIRSGRLCGDNTTFLLRFSNFCVAYDLERPNKRPRTYPAEEWNVHEDKHKTLVLPNWLLHSGVSDGHLNLNQTAAGTGVWRTDSWEQVLDLGGQGTPIYSWVSTSDASVVLGIRPRPTCIHLIWDLKAFEVVEWNEPRILPDCVPSFTSDGRILRFARGTDNGNIEFVSRDWRAGVESVDHLADAVRLDNTLPLRGRKLEVRWTQINAVFSDDAMSLAIKTPTETRILRWNGEALPSIEVLQPTFNANELAGVSPDGTEVYYVAQRAFRNAEKSQTGSSESAMKSELAWREAPEPFEGRVWNTANSLSSIIASVSTAGHTPYFNFQSCPSIIGETLGYRAVGQSMGPYKFGLFWRLSRKTNWQKLTNSQAKGLVSAVLSHPRSGQGSILIALFDSALRVLNPQSGALLAETVRADLWRASDKRFAAPKNGRVFLPLKGGGAQVLDIGSDGDINLIASLWSPVPGSWLALLPDGRYSISAEATPPIFFRLRNLLYPIEELDAEHNQPDAVALAVGSDRSTVAALRDQRKKRLIRLNKEQENGDQSEGRPTLTIRYPPPVLHDSAFLILEGTVRASQTDVVALDLFVNDVPVFGLRGVSFMCSATKSRTFRIKAPMIPGSNKLQVGARTVLGSKSLKELFLVHRIRGSVRPRRFVLAIGVSEYDDTRLRLLYPSKDAADIAPALTAGGGRFYESKILTLIDKEARHSNIIAAKTFLLQTRSEDEVIIFLAGHGGIDQKGNYFFCPSDFQSQGLVNRLTFSDIENLFDDIPALARLLLVDSCRSGELTVEQEAEIKRRYSSTLAARNVYIKNSRHGSNRFHAQGGASQAAREMFIDLRRSTGATILSACGGLEFAIEGGGVDNGLFTHAILSVLASSARNPHRGDLSASELVRAASMIVEDLTCGQQRPNARFINRALDFPVISSCRLRPPGQAEDIIRNFVRWVNGANNEFEPRLLSCSTDEVFYFTDAKPLCVIEEIERSYHKRFRIRDNKIVNLISREELDGSVVIDYTLRFDLHGDIEIDEAQELLVDKRSDSVATGVTGAGGHLINRVAKHIAS